VIVFLLLVANIINLGADLGAMGEATRLLLGGAGTPLRRRLCRRLRLAGGILPL
jgi:hypothetical protein